MKFNKLIMLGASACSIAFITGCNNSNRNEEKKLDTIYEHTDRDGHPLDNRDTVVEYKANPDMTTDTALRGDKH